MKWFQLHTNSLYDPKIVKLIKQHGIAGYGVYMGINVLIAERDADDFTLEHDVDGLMVLFNDINVQAIVDSCIEIGLLSTYGGLIQNVKLSKYVGNWQKRSKPTEALQRPYVDPTAKKEEKEGRERKKEEKETANVNSDLNKSPLNVNGPKRLTAKELFQQAEDLAKQLKTQ